MNRECNILIIGLGPSGIAAAQVFSNSSLAEDVTCIDAGPPVEKRKCPVLSSSYCVRKTNCQIITGFGGASLKAGGKLSLYPAGRFLDEITGIKKETKKEILKSFELYASDLTLSPPSVNSDKLALATPYYLEHGFKFHYYDSFLYSQQEFSTLNKKLQDQLLNSRLDIQFYTKAVNITKFRGGFTVHCLCRGKTTTITANKLILGLGRHGRAFFRLLNEGLGLNGIANKIDVGIRIEFPSSLFQDIDSYHNDLKLKTEKCKTFCVSKGGRIALYYLDNVLFTEGYDDYKNPTEFTNLSLLYRIEAKNSNLDFYDNLIRKLIRQKEGIPIRQNYYDFILGKESRDFSSESTLNCWGRGDINEFLPPNVLNELKPDLQKLLEGFIDRDRLHLVSLFFPELNYGGFGFSPDKAFQVCPGIHVIGECTGRFLGILQSHASGRICAEAILKENEKNE